MEMNESGVDDPRWDCLRNGKRVLDVFQVKRLPVIQTKECHRPDMMDFGRKLDGSESIRCVGTGRRMTMPTEEESLTANPKSPKS